MSIDRLTNSTSGLANSLGRASLEDRGSAGSGSGAARSEANWFSASTMGKTQQINLEMPVDSRQSPEQWADSILANLT